MGDYNGVAILTTNLTEHIDVSAPKEIPRPAGAFGPPLAGGG